MYTLQEANIIDVEVDRSNLIVAIEAPIEARLKSDILVFFSLIIYGRRKHDVVFLQHRGKFNQTQGSLKHDIFRRAELKNSIIFSFAFRDDLSSSLYFFSFFFIRVQPHFRAWEQLEVTLRDTVYWTYWGVE